MSKARDQYRQDAGAGDLVAALNLGLLSESEGDQEEAETGYRQAARAADVAVASAAANNLGALLQERGYDTRAEQWYRKAAALGSTDGAYNAGLLLARAGRREEADKWYRVAAGDHPHAAYLLGLSSVERGQYVLAEEWAQSAAAEGYLEAADLLGLLLEQRGDARQAELWFQRGADRGDPGAAKNLALLKERLGEERGSTELAGGDRDDGTAGDADGWGKQDPSSPQVSPSCYEDFLSSLKEQGRLWGLSARERWALASGDAQEEALAVWLSGGEARECATDEWKGKEPQSISLDDWTEVWLPDLAENGQTILIHCVPDRSTVVSAAVMLDDLIGGNLEPS